ncbi:MAG: hypothetical protein AB7F20_08205 [Geoalkalibacter sp.]|uniref:hypothetical protein n=1 Tax=Geoalkalibacter sp. TaxID=3041440 RepID=UPI003D107010
MKHPKHFLFLAMGVLLSLALSAPASAAGPWKFSQQLPARDAGITLDYPMAITMDEQTRRYYVVDAGRSQLVSFNQDGTLHAAFNAGGRLDRPIAMARGSKGTLWVINRGANELLHINVARQKVDGYSIGYPDGAPAFPAGVAVDEKDRLFILDGMRGAVLLMDDNLEISRQFAGENNFQGFRDFVLKADGLWALESSARKVYHFSMDGALVKVIQLSGLEFPVALELDAGGQIYVLDRRTGIVTAFGRDGAKRFDFLGKGKRHGQIWNGTDLLFDWSGRHCVADEGSGQVEILTR